VRKRWRLPPLALPTASYWLAMGGLTYFFAHLGPHPLDAALASELPAPRAEQPVTAPEPAPPNVVDAAPAAEPAPAVEPAPVVEPAAEATEPATEPSHPVASPAPEESDNRKAGRRGEFVGSEKEQEPAPRVAPSFPEFTDSSRAASREHAADGPRIDSLFERAGDRPSPEAPTEPRPPETAPEAPIAVSSCEAAIARNNEQLTIGAARGAPDISREAYASILQNGRYLSACNIPERTVFEICAAVKTGRAIGITVVSSPASSELNGCVRRAVSRLKFPSNERLDVTHTRFDAASR
jgi:hypothetical protein